MDIKEICWALNRTWNAIGGDILEATGESSLPQDHVVEIVLDANYFEMYSGLTDAETAEFRKLPWNEQNQIANKAFTYGAYGY